MTYVDIQLILEFKTSFGKYHPVFPKNPRILKFKKLLKLLEFYDFKNFQTSK